MTKIFERWIEKFRKEAILKLVEKFKSDKVILFGSRVRKTAKKE
jgi:predicted nucleotidyltransferase